MQNQTQTRYDPKKFSILVPVYNEEESIAPFFERINPVIAEIEKTFGYSVELIFTDNASEDNTYDEVIKNAQGLDNVKIYRFSRNFGFQRSIISGYALSKGAACVQIDCDLEDPPELIIEFIQKWHEGNKVVYGQRKHRNENWFLKSGRTLFYKTVNYLSETNIPEHAGDFRLIDRRIIDIICQVNDAEPYLRGLIANLGFKQVGIKYDRSSRVAGTSSFNLRSYISLAAEGILQTSIRPLNLALYLSVGVLIVSVILATYYIFSALTSQIPETAQGFATIIVVSLFQFSFLLLVVGINSLYLGRIYRQVFKRPISIIAQSNNVELDNQHKLTYWPSEPCELPENEKSLEHIGKGNKNNGGDGA